MRYRRRTAPQGFTLVEVLVTLVVLSTGIVMVLQAFETSLVALADARSSLWGTFLARQKTADAELALLSGTPPPAATGERFEAGPYRGFQCIRTVVRMAEVPAPPAGKEAGAVYEIAARVSSGDGNRTGRPPFGRSTRALG